MKRGRSRVLWALLLLMTWSCFLVAASHVKILKVRNQNPTDLVDTLRRLYGAEARLAEAPNINAIIVSSERPEVIDAVEKLLRELDQKPATLRYEIQSLGSAQDSRLLVQQSAGGKLQVRQERERRKGQQNRVIVGLEGQDIGLVDETTRVETLASPWGPQGVVIRENRGLRVRGRLSGAGEAIIEVRYSEGDSGRSTQVLSQNLVPLGQWVEIGGMGNSAGSQGQTVGLQGTSPEGDLNRLHTLANQRFLLKVEKVTSGR